jgi:hypothetical protein
MSAWLDELRRALDSAPRPVSFFFRDDDAGWCDERLIELLDLFALHSLPVDVAAIPAALPPSMAVELRARVEAAPRMVGVHQHGFAHQNHEPEGRRKCEFGVARERTLQRSDIESGKARLFDLFGPNVSPIFTPPWNRCTAVTGECLLGAGFSVLSRDLTAAPLNLDGLFELPVTIDWFARRKGVRLGLDELGSVLAATTLTHVPVGIMFHHALMDESERKRTGELLATLASHPNARGYLMEQLAADLSQNSRANISYGATVLRSAVVPLYAPVERK